MDGRWEIVMDRFQKHLQRMDVRGRIPYLVSSCQYRQGKNEDGGRRTGRRQLLRKERDLQQCLTIAMKAP